MEITGKLTYEESLEVIKSMQCDPLDNPDCFSCVLFNWKYTHVDACLLSCHEENKVDKKWEVREEYDRQRKIETSRRARGCVM